MSAARGDWGAAALLGGREGQMTVELAVLTPVVIVVALTIVNLMGFVEACAAFDQAAPDAVVAHGVAPAGEQDETRAAAEVRSAIEELLGREGRCEVEVRAEAVSVGSTSTGLVMSPLLTRYVCTLTYHPWPRLLRMPGVTYEAPLALRHECELVVDRFRPGVVV